MEKAKPVSTEVVKDVKQMTFPYHTDKTDDFTAEEVNLANRCHGLPLEGLDLALTPAGMHYLLIHFDIPIGPATAEATYRLKLRGLVDRELELSMADIRRRPRVSIPVTMECAGNGRINMKKRYLLCLLLTDFIPPLHPLHRGTCLFGVSFYSYFSASSGIGHTCRGKMRRLARQCGRARR